MFDRVYGRFNLNCMLLTEIKSLKINRIVVAKSFFFFSFFFLNHFDPQVN